MVTLKDTGHRVGLNAGNVFVRLVVHNARQDHVSIDDRNADRVCGIDRVLVERGIAVYGTGHPHARLVVHRRQWIHLDLVDDILDARRALREVQRGLLGHRPQRMATQVTTPLFTETVMALKALP